MSLILDALRKSEAERQRGKSPGLFATTPGIQREYFPRMKLWPVLVFLALLLASAWVIWRGEARHAQGEQTATAIAWAADQGIEVVVATAGTGNQADGATRPIPTSPSAPPSSSMPAKTEPVGPQAIPARTSTPAPAAPTVVAAPSPPTFANATSPAFPATLPSTPDIVPDTPAAASLPTVAILDSGTRASLPALKLSMHVFGQDPAKRFAIIDGKRVGAGSLLGNGVVEEINRDGVVINVNGQRLLVPKP